jgi:NAD(P)H-hydrate epimerase
MAFLTRESIEDVQQDRVASARTWAQTWGHVVVLKGAYTVVAEPSGRTSVIPVASPALASAGTGDVLAGMIAGLRAQGLDAYRAAVLGAYLHARAGVLSHEALGAQASVIAGDVVDSIPTAIAELVQRSTRL